MPWLQDALHNENHDRIGCRCDFLSGILSKIYFGFVFMQLIIGFLRVLSCIACSFIVSHDVFFWIDNDLHE